MNDASVIVLTDRLTRALALARDEQMVGDGTEHVDRVELRDAINWLDPELNNYGEFPRAAAQDVARRMRTVARYIDESSPRLAELYRIASVTIEEVRCT